MKLRDVDLVDPDTFVTAMPHEMFRVLRAEAPVYWHEEPDGPGFWAITRYRDVVTISRDPGTFSSALGSAMRAEQPPEHLETQRLMMLNMDPPRHNKQRSLVNKAFTPRMVMLLEPRVRRAANDIIDAIAERGECDFVKSIAAELPLMVIAEMLGVPHEDRHVVFSCSNRMIGMDDPEYRTTPEDGMAAATEMYAYANQLALERRDHPRDDLVSALMTAEVDGERLTELEFDLFFILLSVAGNETTRNLISGGMHALLEHPEQRDRLLDDPALVPSAVEEMLRWVSPVMNFRRTTTRDAEIRGQKIANGQKVVMYYPSANRDEEIFRDPFTFDVARHPNEHLAFGIGQHFCLGAKLARLEIRIMFEELLRRLPDIELAGPVRRLRSNFINGIKEMPIRFTPERRA
jgi:cholest-4-en-3-one 26-monooxygenase